MDNFLKFFHTFHVPEINFFISLSSITMKLKMAYPLKPMPVNKKKVAVILEIHKVSVMDNRHLYEVLRAMK